MSSLKDEKTYTRREEEGNRVNFDPTCHRDTRTESQSPRYQQERVNRTADPQSNISLGTSSSGGMVSQLILEYQDQLASKQEEKKRLEYEVQRVQNEIKRLESKIQDFKVLQEEINTENNS